MFSHMYAILCELSNENDDNVVSRLRLVVMNQTLMIGSDALF